MVLLNFVIFLAEIPSVLNLSDIEFTFLRIKNDKLIRQKFIIIMTLGNNEQLSTYSILIENSHFVFEALEFIYAIRKCQCLFRDKLNLNHV